jgi:hypothetical protein
MTKGRPGHKWRWRPPVMLHIKGAQTCILKKMKLKYMQEDANEMTLNYNFQQIYESERHEWLRAFYLHTTSGFQ